MSHPRVEEVSDSDPDAISDPDEGDIDDFVDTDIIRRVVPDDDDQARRSSPSQSQSHQRAAAQSHILDPADLNPLRAGNGGGGGGGGISPDEHAAYMGFQTLYPVYFDATRSRAEGRRVPAHLAVRNPLARDIANACSRLRLQTLLEPEKTHPKDWANPGRVKVGLKHSSSSVAVVKNKHHLYTLVARHLADNPTTESSAGLRLRVGGQLQPPEGKPYPRPAVPRGWKMGDLLPYLSPAMTGGGVSENLFKDMMKEMQGGGDPMAALMASQQAGAAGGSGSGSGLGMLAADEGGAAGGGGKKKKDKKAKGRA
ncbi:signal recognition particle subunit [Purpureocillium takamizusanense]|uniref:Signal recognition particle subunit n=1 Tax=Purpureocillium takamizusanense TaxID=2060973 RepID=A0A9Q8VCP2_9HYPO|nr:signal recognition particle subunit [Purpureocillium takamizusanense]UNI20012.1 signal recognition particle subunit [Purpureocillium takamizusanense]